MNSLQPLLQNISEDCWQWLSIRSLHHTIASRSVHFSGKFPKIAIFVHVSSSSFFRDMICCSWFSRTSIFRALADAFSSKLTSPMCCLGKARHRSSQKFALQTESDRKIGLYFFFRIWLSIILFFWFEKWDVKLRRKIWFEKYWLLRKFEKLRIVILIFLWLSNPGRVESHIGLHCKIKCAGWL